MKKNPDRLRAHPDPTSLTRSWFGYHGRTGDAGAYGDAQYTKNSQHRKIAVLTFPIHSGESCQSVPGSKEKEVMYRQKIKWVENGWGKLLKKVVLLKAVIELLQFQNSCEIPAL
jgi:hypothetical protein